MKSWLQASRLPSQIYIFVPLLVGQLLASGGFRAMDWSVFVLVHLVGLFDQLFIVYSNDYFDQQSDAQNKNHNMFTGGSRVLVEGKIEPAQLKQGYRLVAALALFCSIGIAFIQSAYYAPFILILGLFLMVLYSFPPFQFSYRGGGEFLQALGVGVILPIFGYYSQAGNLQVFPYEILWIILPSQLSCALSTTIPDYESDKMSGKRTFSVLLGVQKIRPIIVGLQCFSIYKLGVIASVGRGLSASLFSILLVMIALSYLPLKNRSKQILYVGLNIFLTTLITLASLHILLGL